MTSSTTHRLTTAWLLSLGLLLGLLACGLHHGQAAGLALSGLTDGGFCSHSLSTGPAVELASPMAEVSSLHACPLCSSFGPTLAPFDAGGLGLLAGEAPSPAALAQWPGASPRLLRPALAPRASPLPNA
ncbi:hypothetical protein [Stutzerimonas azotifigens]|uniref:hypothetical protein n=1 Tax=Stutzerimonas azotifigens TaxID=291995 RepID=UPI0004228A14|nr:hypothetical protein [Stutzerimonas azotifigens]